MDKKRIFLLLSLSITASCGLFDKDNKINEPTALESLKERDAMVCEKSKPLFDQWGGTVDPNCDAAIFTSLHGLQCSYVNVGIFESQMTGKLCRRPGCTCYDNQTNGTPTSDSGFSKDQAGGLQAFYSANPDGPLAVRVQEYGIANDWVVCKAETPADVLGKCLMSPKIVYRWAEIERKAADIELEGLENQPEQDDNSGPELALKADFEKHLDIVSIVTEWQLYDGISDASLKLVEQYAIEEPNNLLFQAMNARFVSGSAEEVAQRLLDKFPSDRLATTDDWCEPYLFQRSEFRNGTTNPDWLPCGGGRPHPGTDYLFASYVLQLGSK